MKNGDFMKIIYCFLAVSTIFVTNSNVFASGKQFRPPAVDICEIDPESDECKESLEKKEKSRTKE